MEFSEYLNEPVGGSGFFIWKEALWLPRWRVYALPDSLAVQENLEATAYKMNLLRDFFGHPLVVTSWYRPASYNALIGGSSRSSHQDGLACDFIVKGQESHDMRNVLKDHLKEFNIRLEAEATPHLHIDLRCSASHSNDQRYFKANARIL